MRTQTLFPLDNVIDQNQWNTAVELLHSEKNQGFADALFKFSPNGCPVISNLRGLVKAVDKAHLYKISGVPKSETHKYSRWIEHQCARLKAAWKLWLRRKDYKQSRGDGALALKDGVEVDEEARLATLQYPKEGDGMEVDEETQLATIQHPQDGHIFTWPQGPQREQKRNICI